MAIFHRFIELDDGTIETGHPDFFDGKNNGWLVVWNINFIFAYIGLLIIPTDFHIFQRGGSTTNQFMLVKKMIADWLGWSCLGMVIS